MQKNLLDLLRSSSKLSVQKHPPRLQIITVCVWLFGCARLGKVAVAPAASVWKPLKEKASRRKKTTVVAALKVYNTKDQCSVIEKNSHVRIETDTLLCDSKTLQKRRDTCLLRLYYTIITFKNHILYKFMPSSIYMVHNILRRHFLKKIHINLILDTCHMVNLHDKLLKRFC